MFVHIIKMVVVTAVWPVSVRHCRDTVLYQTVLSRNLSTHRLDSQFSFWMGNLDEWVESKELYINHCCLCVHLNWIVCMRSISCIHKRYTYQTHIYWGVAFWTGKNVNLIHSDEY